MKINKTISLLFLFLFLLLASISVAATSWFTSMENGEKGEGLVTAASDHNSTLESEQSRPLRRLLRQSSPRSATTCDEYPKICHMEGSPGHHCCKKHCVSLKKDNLNCGKCGKKCKHGEECCHGKCVNILFDRKNCGGCDRKCKKGSYCRYGMCSYA